MINKKYASDDPMFDETNNPCTKEQLMSMKCLDDNDYNTDKCEKYFLNYKNCKLFWASVCRERRAVGLKPVLPAVAERDEFKKKYQQTGKVFATVN